MMSITEMMANWLYNKMMANWLYNKMMANWHYNKGTSTILMQIFVLLQALSLSLSLSLPPSLSLSLPSLVVEGCTVCVPSVFRMCS